jgi:O-antigen/teichoic acid export membrane protein
MRNHVSNAAYGVLDYAAYPVTMLLAAPILLRHLGVAQYGVWVVAIAVLNTGGIIASGFGDANIQYVASVRGKDDNGLLVGSVRSMMGINLLLGFALALVSWFLAPLAVIHLVPSDRSLQTMCLWSLRIASGLMLVRAIESVCISTQRAFERYGAAVRISLLARILTPGAAMLLVIRGYGVRSIMVATALLMVLGTAAQMVRLRQLINGASLLPAFDRQAVNMLFGFGAFSWVIAVSGVVFTQADRLILGVSLGAATVTAYALCVQLAQPIYGFASSGLHFLFPYLAARNSESQPARLQKPILIACAANLMLVLVGTVAVLMLGRPLLTVWVGPAIAQSAAEILAPIAWSFALLGLNVTAYYGLLALGQVRIVTLLNLVGGATMLLLMIWLLPRHGIRGVATARSCYGVITFLMYYPLLRGLRGTRESHLSTSGLRPVSEEI